MTRKEAVEKTAQEVSIPITVVGGLQFRTSWFLDKVCRFNTDNGRGRAAIVERTKRPSVAGVSFNTDNGRGRAAILGRF